MRQLGVVHQVTHPVFLGCAEAVAAQWAQVVTESQDALAFGGEGGDAPDGDAALATWREEVLSRAELLTKHLRDNQRLLTLGSEESNLQLGRLPILCVTHPATGETGLVSYSQSTAPPDRLLTGIIKPCPGEEHFVSPNFWSKLGLQSPPAAESVVENLERLPQVLADMAWPLPDVTPERIILAAYEYMASRWESLDEGLRQRLKAAPAVLVGRGQAVPCSRLFHRIDRDFELAPWLMEVPMSYRPMEAILNQLGVRDRPSTEAVLAIWNDILLARETTALRPTEYVGLVHTLRFMRRHDPQVLRDRADIPVPSIDGKLLRKRNCVYADADTADLIGKIATERLQLTFASQLISEDLAAACELKRISDVVQLRWRDGPPSAVDRPQLPSHLGESAAAVLMQVLQEHYAGQVSGVEGRGGGAGAFEVFFLSLARAGLALFPA